MRIPSIRRVVVLVGVTIFVTLLMRFWMFRRGPGGGGGATDDDDGDVEDYLTAKGAKGTGRRGTTGKNTGGGRKKPLRPTTRKSSSNNNPVALPPRIMKASEGEDTTEVTPAGIPDPEDHGAVAALKKHRNEKEGATTTDSAIVEGGMAQAVIRAKNSKKSTQGPTGEEVETTAAAPQGEEGKEGAEETEKPEVDDGGVPSTDRSRLLQSLLESNAFDDSEGGDAAALGGGDPAARSQSKDVFSPQWKKFPTWNFGSKPTLQQVFNNIKMRLEAPTSDEDVEFQIPVYGALATHTDFLLYLNQLYHCDTFVDRFFVTLNGWSDRGSTILMAFRDAFPGRFLVKINKENAGVSAGWNNVLRATFVTPGEKKKKKNQKKSEDEETAAVAEVAAEATTEATGAAGDVPTKKQKKRTKKAGPKKTAKPAAEGGDDAPPEGETTAKSATGDNKEPDPPFCIIGNADVQPKPGMLGRWAQTLRAKGHAIVNSRFAHFAMFATTQFGFDHLGFFDEVVFPAYGEDIEYHVRAVSKGLGLESGPFHKFGSNNAGDTYLHNHATNLQGGASNPSYGDQVGRWGKGDMYVMQKWGVSIGGTVDFQFSRPFSHPFNNKKIWHSQSWVVDPVHRKCIVEGTHGGGCRYNVDVTKVLEHDSPQPPVKARTSRPSKGQMELDRMLKDPTGKWIEVAVEGGSFTYPLVDQRESAATRKIKTVARYAADSWIESVQLESETSKFRCHTDTFGKDPAWGVEKSCEVWNHVSNAWVRLGKENEVFNLKEFKGPEGDDAQAAAAAAGTSPYIGDGGVAKLRYGLDVSVVAILPVSAAAAAAQGIDLPPQSSPPAEEEAEAEAAAKKKKNKKSPETTLTLPCSSKVFKADPASGSSKRCHVFWTAAHGPIGGKTADGADGGALKQPKNADAADGETAPVKATKRVSKKKKQATAAASPPEEA